MFLRQLYRPGFQHTFLKCGLNDFFVFLRCSCNGCFLKHILLWSDLNWGILCSYVNYIEQSLSTLFEKCIFGGVLSDVNYEYLVMMLCEIIDRIGFGLG